jgi:predicted ArsR family transcriptional regulator
MGISPVNRDDRRILEAFMEIAPEDDRHINLIARIADTTPPAAREHLESLQSQGLVKEVLREQSGKSHTF